MKVVHKTHHSMQLLLCLTIISQAAAATYKVQFDSIKGTKSVAPGFVGLALDPLRELDTYANDAVFIRLLRHVIAFGTGPLNLKLGGETQEDDDLITNEAWVALKNLYNTTGGRVSFSIPLNLLARSSRTALKQIQNAKANGIPREAVYAINIGNEPDKYAYEDGHNPVYTRSWFRDGYLSQVEAYIKAVEVEVGKWLHNTQIFAGPGVWRITSFPVTQVEKWAILGVSQTPAGEDDGYMYTKAVTLHMYGVRGNGPEKYTKEGALLSEDSMMHLKRVTASYARAANVTGLKLRIDEVGTMDDGGLPGVCDTMEGVLWTIDLAFSLLEAGAAGFNVHTSGCSPNSPVLFPSACESDSEPSKMDKYKVMCGKSCGDRHAKARVNTGFYALWFIQKLLKGHNDLVVLPSESIMPTNAPADHIKLHAIISPKTLRIVILNKGQTDEKVTLVAPGNPVWGFGTVTVLKGKRGMRSTSADMTLAGRFIDEVGNIRGKTQTCKLAPTLSEGVGTLYEYVAPAASAVVVVVPKVTVLAGPRYQQWLKEGLPADLKC